MHTLARISTDDTDDLRALHTWLNDEYELRGNVRWVDPADREHQRELDGVVDVLTVPIEGTAGVALASSLDTWLRNNRTDTTVTVVRGYLKVTLRPTTMSQALPFLEGLLETDEEEAWLC